MNIHSHVSDNRRRKRFWDFDLCLMMIKRVYKWYEIWGKAGQVKKFLAWRFFFLWEYILKHPCQMVLKSLKIIQEFFFNPTINFKKWLDHDIFRLIISNFLPKLLCIFSLDLFHKSYSNIHFDFCCFMSTNKHNKRN